MKACYGRVAHVHAQQQRATMIPAHGFQSLTPLVRTGISHHLAVDADSIRGIPHKVAAVSGKQFQPVIRHTVGQSFLCLTEPFLHQVRIGIYRIETRYEQCVYAFSLRYHTGLSGMSARQHSEKRHAHAYDCLGVSLLSFHTRFKGFPFSIYGLLTSGGGARRM